MNTEQEHANFEAWWREEMSPRITGNGPLLRKISWDVWQARAALAQEQGEKHDNQD